MLVDRPEDLPEGEPEECPQPSLAVPTFAPEELQSVLFESADPAAVTLSSLFRQCSYGAAGSAWGRAGPAMAGHARLAGTCQHLSPARRTPCCRPHQRQCRQQGDGLHSHALLLDQQVGGGWARAGAGGPIECKAAGGWRPLPSRRKTGAVAYLPPPRRFGYESNWKTCGYGDLLACECPPAPAPTAPSRLAAPRRALSPRLPVLGKQVWRAHPALQFAALSHHRAVRPLSLPRP